MNRYADFTREQLIARLEALDPALATSTAASIPQFPKKSKLTKPPFHFPSHPTRHIALLVAYHGWPYSGLAIQSATLNSPEPDTVESELLRALERTRLVEAGKGWEGCGYGRGGRTDRGVSGDGQVVDLRVRSTLRSGDEGGGWKEALVPPPPRPIPTEDVASEPTATIVKFDPQAVKELPYPRILNAVLPASIRILAWSPVGPCFSSRFSCIYRHYKYVFHPIPRLSIPLMQEAADLLVGEHDFRNFCRLDGSKQILNHSRRVVQAWFQEQEAGEGRRMVVFNLIGSAFLWHQVRHIIGILFLVGSHLEAPSVVSELLDVETNPSRPNYQMGNPLPLTLHSCGYPNRQLDWRISGNDGMTESFSAEERAEEATMRDGIEKQLEEAQQEAEIRAWQIGGGLRTLRKVFGMPETVDNGEKGTAVSYPVGGGEVVGTRKYMRVMERSRGDTPDEVNHRWREKNRGKVKAGSGEELEME